MSRELSDKQIKADLMHRLLRRCCWGSRYLPLETLVRWIGSRIKRDGRKVQKAVRQLVNEGYLILHKKGKTVSLNPAKSREITEFLRKFLV